MSKINDLTGVKFGRLTVIERADNKGHHTRWLCKCDCGNTTISHAYTLTSGKAKSCGCLNKENLLNTLTKHGGRHTKLYETWCHMKNRCFNKNYEHYKDYGGRGIKICDEWLNDFASFRDWAIKSGYKHDLTIERKDVNKDYEPENCTWVTQKEQVRNRRNTVWVLYKGTKTSLAKVAEETGLNYKYLHARYKAGTIEELAVGVTYYDMALKAR